MILYIFNNPFPDNSGFAIRCRREIDAISKIDDVVIICRKNNRSEEPHIYSSSYKQIPIVRFKANYKLIERPQKYMNGIYEVIRNAKLLLNLTSTLVTTINKYKAREMVIYSVCSPLTVPFICWLISWIKKVKLEVIEYHDLEPELAKHIKGLDENNLVYKVELWLERLLSNAYKKVIVTSQGQAKRIALRTGKRIESIFVIPNTVEKHVYDKQSLETVREKYKLTKSDYIVGCLSTFSFDYTITGVIEIIDNFSKLQERIPNIKLVFVGDGDGLVEIQKAAQNNENVIITGKVKNVHEVMQIIDVGIIPWKQNEMTETILPTKLFDYMAARKPIIAPNYGEFKNVLVPNDDALLYNSIDELIYCIETLSKNKTLANFIQDRAYHKYINHYQPSIYEKELQRLITI